MSSPIVLITGALTGIGRRRRNNLCARRGTHCCVWASRQTRQELVAELQALGAEAIFVRTDVRKDEDMHLVTKRFKVFGRLDIAVIMLNRRQPGP